MNLLQQIRSYFSDDNKGSFPLLSQSRKAFMLLSSGDKVYARYMKEAHGINSPAGRIFDIRNKGWKVEAGWDYENGEKEFYYKLIG